MARSTASLASKGIELTFVRAEHIPQPRRGWRGCAALFGSKLVARAVQAEGAESGMVVNEGVEPGSGLEMGWMLRRWHGLRMVA